MNDRNLYDLTHLSHIAGHIGRLQTNTVIPVEAGASLELSMDSIVRMAPFRKEIVSDAKIDIGIFFVPHRHIYGQAWIDFINGGPDAVAAFTGIAIASQYRTPEYLALPTCGANLNRALLEGYNRIFHNYYTIPGYRLTADSPATNANVYDWYPTTETGAANCRKYGRLTARLPHVLNGATVVDAGGTVGWEAQELTQTDVEVPAAAVLDIRDLAQIQSRYKTEAQAAWFAHFYQDVMREKWGSDLGPDVDPRNLRPTMLMRHSQWMSGGEVAGADDATLGQFQGRTMERVGWSMPRKFFGEHGLVFVLTTVRFPLVHTREAHPLLQLTNYTYDEIAGDPERIANLAPVGFDPNPWLAGGSTYPAPGAGFQTTQQPYGQHYRFQPNRVHPAFDRIPGYPFSKWNGTTLRDWYYHADNEYNDAFMTSQIGQWQQQAKIIAQKYSPVPGVASSIFAGT